MLEAEGLCVNYGAVGVLDRVGFRIAKGSLVAILGSNGAGKSTLLRTISGLMRARAGSIRFDGEDIGRLPAERIVARGVAHVPEGRGIFPDLTVRENLRVGAYSRRDKTALAADYEGVLAQFPALRERVASLGYTLSGGEQQMLAIGRALMSRPRLLLADEVSLGLAPVIIGRLFEELVRLRARGMTLLIVEQNATLAMRIADYVYVLKHGQVVLEGTPDQLASDRKLVEAYLGT